MKKSVELAAHLFFWTVFTAFVYMLCRIYLQDNPESNLSNHLFYLVFLEVAMGLILFYITFFGIPQARKKKINPAILATVVLSILIIFAWPATRHGKWEVLSSVIPHLIIVFIAILFRKFSDIVKLEKEKYQLIMQNTESELALLKMQISPHFLFNILNNIDYLISSDADKASASISKLADILRYMIYDAKASRISLSDEIRHIEDYVGLIRLRTSGSGYLNYNMTGNTGQLQIAPMIFIPLLENAYKHSSAKEGENIINIEINIDETDFYFRSDNEFNVSKEEGQASGIGLNIVRRRLELIYPGKHFMNISKTGKRYIVELKLKLDEY